MQITAELDSQHLEKLQTLETQLQQNTSEFIAWAIDKIYQEKNSPTEGQTAYQLMQQSGFIDCLELNENLSENYKEHLDWSHKV